MATLAELELRIKSLEAVKAKRNLDDFGKAANRAAKESKRLEKNFKEQDKTTQKLNKSYKEMTGRLKGLVAGISALLVLSQAVTVFAEFEQTMAEVGGVSKATGKEFEALTAQARELGAVTRFSARQAADAQLALTRAGFEVNDTIKTSKAVLDLASAAQLELGRAAEITAITMKQFGLEASNAVQITDVLVNTANSATTNVEGLAQGLKFAGSIASSFGKDLEETAAALGVIADSGLDASQAGTGLRGVFARLGDPIGKAAKTLDTLANRLGETREIFDITENSLADIFQAFRDAGASTQDFIRIFGRLQAPAALALVGNVEKIRELTEANKNAAGETEILADRINNTLKGSLLALKSAAEEAANELGDSFLGKAFKGLIDFTRDVVLAMSNFESELVEISPAAKALAFILKALGASLGVLATRWVVVKVEMLSARVAAIGLTASLRGLRVALASTGIGLAAVLAGELVNALSETNSEIDKIADEFDDFEKAQKKSTVATKEQARALEELQTAALAGQATLQKSQDRLNAAAIKLRRLREGGTEETIRQIDAELELLRVNTNAARAKFKGQDLTLKQLADIEHGTFKVLAVERAVVEEITRQDRARKAAKKSAREQLENQQKLADFLKEQEVSVGESGLSRAAVAVERLETEFEQLFLATKKVSDTIDLSDADFTEFERGLDLISEQQRKIAENKDLGRIISQGASATATLSDALETTNHELAIMRAQAEDRSILQTQQEFAHAVEQTQASLEAQNVSPDELISGLVEVNELVAKIAENRGLALLIQDGEAAEQGMLELEDSLLGVLTPLEEFKILGDIALEGYAAKIKGTAGEQEAFAARQQEINARISEFEANLERIALSEKLGDIAESLTLSFHDFFSEIITGSKTAAEAALDLFREISNLAFKKLALEPLINALRAGIGAAAGAAGAGSGSGFSLIGSAQGNAFRNGQIQAFAQGGIIGGPTLFPLGLAGEAGPEAILPLKRDSSGNLGVSQVDSRPQRRATLMRPFVSAAVSTGASEAPSRQEAQRGGTRIINQQMNITSIDPNAFRQSSSQIQADAMRQARVRGRF